MSILVRNLPKSFTQEDLFFECGTMLSCDLVMDDKSGLSKGFGFVEMSTQEETDKAIKTLNAKVIEGKKIRVKWSNQEKKQAEAAEYETPPPRDIPADVWANANRTAPEQSEDSE